MRDHTETDESAGGASTPEPVGLPFERHAQEHSFSLQMMMDVTNQVARLEERTNGFGLRIQELRTDVRGIPGRTEFWAGLAIVITVMLALGGMINTQLSSHRLPEPPPIAVEEPVDRNEAQLRAVPDRVPTKPNS